MIWVQQAHTIPVPPQGAELLDSGNAQGAQGRAGMTANSSSNSKATGIPWVGALGLYRNRQVVIACLSAAAVGFPLEMSGFPLEPGGFPLEMIGYKLGETRNKISAHMLRNFFPGVNPHPWGPLLWKFFPRYFFPGFRGNLGLLQKIMKFAKKHLFFKFSAPAARFLHFSGPAALLIFVSPRRCWWRLLSWDRPGYSRRLG